MSLKAVLFDMDGVIVDTEPLHRKAYFEMFDSYGIKVSESLYDSFTGKATARVCQELVRHFSLTCSVQELMAKKRERFKYLFDHDPDFDLIPGVLDLIKNYHQNGIKLVLASSASRNTINWVFERFDLDRYFIDKISGAELAASKPHPEIFLLAAQKASEAVENCMVIEDSTNGIKASHAAGIYCVAFKSAHTKNQDYTLADRVISDFKEIYTGKIII